MIDLHTHTLESDGELLPSELVRRYAVIGCRGVALTDHVDATNIHRVVGELLNIEPFSSDFGVPVLAGVELTHVPPGRIDELARLAKELGARVVVVHGETTAEPVAEDTNLSAVKCDYVDILAHPGMITVEETKFAAKNGVLLEVTSRIGHNLANAHVVSVARQAGAGLVINTDAHAPGDLINAKTARAVGNDAGMTDDEIKRAMELSAEIIEKSRR